MIDTKWAIWNTINNQGRRNPWFKTTSEHIRSKLRRYKKYTDLNIRGFMNYER